jgi:O-antigen ligase
LESTQTPPANPGRAVDRFNYVMGVAWLTLWTSNAVGLLYGYSPINPYYSLVAIYLVYFALARPNQLLAVSTRPLFWVWLLTAILPIVLYWASDRTPEAYASMRNRITVFSGIAGSMVILSGKDPLKMLRAAAKIVFATSVFLNLLEVAIPLLSTSPGRSAGLYQNPNIAAAGIIVCLIILVDFRRHTPRNMVLMAIGLIGVVSTFSRSGMLYVTLLWLAYTLLPRGPGTSPAASRLVVMSALGLVVLMGLLTAWQLGVISDVGQHQIASMLEMQEDYSVQKRRFSALNAWNEFSRHPLAGLGIGAPEYYNLSTHNTYLHLAVEFGILGLLVYLVVSLGPVVKVLRSGIGRSTSHLVMLSFVFYYGTFDHYVHAQGVFCVVFAAIAVDALIDREPQPTWDDAKQVGVRGRIDWRSTPAPAESTGDRLV